MARRPHRDASLRDLVDAARAGDQNAWNEIVRRFERLVWKIAGGFDVDAHSRADICQTTWLRLASCIDQLREPDALPGWLARTARNAGLDVVRRRQRVVLVERFDDRADAAAIDSDAGLLELELQVAVHAAFDRLNGRCQRLLRLLTCVPPLSYAEIVAILDVPHGSIGPTRQRCIGDLLAAPEMRPFLVEGRAQ